jgi:hypothetical protein
MNVDVTAATAFGMVQLRLRLPLRCSGDRHEQPGQSVAGDVAAGVRPTPRPASLSSAGRRTRKHSSPCHDHKPTFEWPSPVPHVRERRISDPKPTSVILVAMALHAE